MGYQEDFNHLYDPARQSPTLEQKQYYTNLTANQSEPWRVQTDPTRQAAYSEWLKSPQQLDFEAWYARKSGSAQDQAYWNAGDAAWQASNPNTAPNALAPPAAPSASTPKEPPRQSATAPAAPQQTPWEAQPKPATQTAGATGTNALAQQPYPALPAGFNLRTGSTDPTDPTGQNQAVYGTNYFPGGLPGFENVTNAQQFAALTPEQQGSYREALYLWNMRNQGYGPQPGGVVPPLPGDPVGNPGYTPPPGTTTPPGGGGGATGPTQPYQNPPFGSVGPSPTGVTTGLGGQADPNNSGFPFPGAYTAPPFDYSNVQDFTQNPAYQARLKESERALQRQLLNMGRSDSTGGQNAFATNARRLASEFEQEAYNRAKGENVLNYDRSLGENMTAYDRALTINKLQYDRQFQENVTNYEREFRENERLYGRQMAENILAYERSFREDARDYERVQWLVANGFIGGNTPSGA